MNAFDAAGALALLACTSTDPYAGLELTRFECPECEALVSARVEIHDNERPGRNVEVHVMLTERRCINSCSITDAQMEDEAKRAAWRQAGNE